MLTSQQRREGEEISFKGLMKLHGEGFVKNVIINMLFGNKTDRRKQIQRKNHTNKRVLQFRRFDSQKFSVTENSMKSRF